MTNNGPCPYVCGNKSAFGYCLTTVCCNPLFKRKYEETQRLLGEYVKIVRCKDCVYKKDCAFTEWMGMNGNGYCSCGERKTNETD